MSAEVKSAYQPHPQWFIDQHTKDFVQVANDADRDLTRDITCETNMYHPLGLTETGYRQMIWDMVFSGRKLVEDRDALQKQRDELVKALVEHEHWLNCFYEGLESDDLAKEIEPKLRLLRDAIGKVSP